MKLIIISVVVLYLTETNSAQDRIVGDLVSFQVAPVTCVVGDNGFKCNTCSTGLLCNGAVSMITMTCAAPSSFCDSKTNQCTSVRPIDCATSTFNCPAAGYYPHMQNCDTYYFCTAAKVSAEYKCPQGYVFDITIKGCKRSILPLDCVTMKCQKANEFIAYSKDPSIYVFCDSTLTGHLFKCPPSLELDKTTNICSFTCKREGMFAGPTPRDAYFCYRQGTTLTHYTMQCPVGYEYDASFECKTAPVRPPVQ